MHVLILLAGVADPRKPLERPSSGDWKDILATPTTPFKLSPFDEAALELGLKLRDSNPKARLTALVTHGARDVALMRAVASHRLDRVVGLPAPPDMRSDPQWLTEHALGLVRSEDLPVDLILIGREHGDLDDGMTPAFLASKWQLPFVGLAQAVHPDGDHAWMAERVGKTATETYRLARPAMISVTNAKSNRLRHPLMKNVLQAKQQKFDILEPGHAPGSVRADTVTAQPPAAVARGSGPCEILQGSIGDRARKLAELLMESAKGESHAG